VTPCSTLEQRCFSVRYGEWSCCARVRGEEMVRDFHYCNLWKPHLTREEALQWFAPLMRRGWHSRPCTSPRRNQCRAGLSHASDLRRFQHERAHGYFPHPPMWGFCQELGLDGEPEPRMYVPIVGGRWDWFNADLSSALARAQQR
jgi:hypothetical protein